MQGRGAIGSIKMGSGWQGVEGFIKKGHQLLERS